MDRSELQKRIVTGVGLAGGFIAIDFFASISYVGIILLSMLILVAVSLAAVEVAIFCSSGQMVRKASAGAILLSPILFWLLLMRRVDSTAAALTSLACGAILSTLAINGVAVVAGRRHMDDALRVEATLYPMLMLIGVGGVSALGIALAPGGAPLIAWIVLVVCTNDIAAYAGGNVLRGPKLAPTISPGKTISGAVCGLLGGVVAAVAGVRLLEAPIDPTGIIIIGLLVSLAAQVGDLSKSAVKRIHQVKDSGVLLPGHGGVLDRIDGILGACLLTFVLVLAGLVR